MIQIRMKKVGKKTKAPEMSFQAFGLSEIFMRKACVTEPFFIRIE